MFGNYSRHSSIISYFLLLFFIINYVYISLLEVTPYRFIYNSICNIIYVLYLFILGKYVFKDNSIVNLLVITIYAGQNNQKRREFNNF